MSLTFNTIPASDATVFHLIWPNTQAPALIDAWQNWAPAAPDELAASLGAVACGDVDRPPVVNLFGAMLGTESDTRELARSWASVHPWGTGRVYPNFSDPDLEDWAHAYYGTNFDRLVRVRGRYDPDDFFHSQQSLPSAR
jgi:hypothetical protein